MTLGELISDVRVLDAIFSLNHIRQASRYDSKRGS